MQENEQPVEIRMEGLIDDNSPNMDMSKEPVIRDFLQWAADKPNSPRDVGVTFAGFKDDLELKRVKETARHIIQENITKLYKTKVKKVAIVGTAMTFKDAPYSDPSWELWGLNDHWNNMPRATRWFEANYEAAAKTPVSHQQNITRLDWLKKCPIPVYMEQHYEDVPMSVRYPFEEINDWISEIDPCGRDYFTNSVSFMIALAIYEGFDVIHLYGVDMAVGCLAPETRVLTADLRWVRSDEVKVGDELMGFDEDSDSGTGKTRKWRKTTVTKIEPLIKPCHEIILEDGTKFIASTKHGWLTHGENINRWKTTDQLVTKHHRTGRPTRILKMIEPWENEDSRDLGYLAAAFDGEGSFSQTPRNDVLGCYHYSLNFAQKNNEMKQKVCELLDKYDFQYTVNDVNKSDCQQINIKGGKAEVMRFLGQIRPYRLLPKFNPETMGEFQSIRNVAVIDSQFVGDRAVIGMETDTKTFIAEGFASHNSEYQNQRPSCEFWVGIAKGRGIKFYIPEASDLLKTMAVYGRCKKREPFLLKLMDRKKFQENQVAQINAEIAKRQDEIQRMSATKFQYMGAIADVEQTLKVWGEM